MQIKSGVCLALVFLMASAIQLQAENDSSIVAAPSLEEFSWLVGHWRGEGLGGVCEETWLPESAGSLLGTFKFMLKDKVQFYELMTITIDSLGPAIRVKHFNADMIGWEDKTEMVTFRYDSTSGNKFFFDGQTYIKPSQDSLKIVLSIKQTDGTISEEMFKFKRIDF